MVKGGVSFPHDTLAETADYSTLSHASSDQEGAADAHA
jgi:hypothetical protein